MLTRPNFPHFWVDLTNIEEKVSYISFFVKYYWTFFLVFFYKIAKSLVGKKSRIFFANIFLRFPKF